MNSDGDRQTVVIRVVLGVLAAVAVMVGMWAALFPASFYSDFPGLGRVWVAADGPFNEHLVRDVGQLFLAMAVVTGVAVAFPVALLVRTVGAAWLVEGLPHLVYHASHTDLYDTVDFVLNLASLSLLVVLAAIALLAPLGSGPASRTT
jgi:hypothetical protein